MLLRVKDSDHETQQQSVETADHSERWAVGATALFVLFFRRTKKEKEDTKKAAGGLIHMQQQVAVSERATDDALRRFTERSKRLGMLGGKVFLLKSQLNQIEKARKATVSDLDDWWREVRAFEAHMRVLCFELVLLKRRESTNCDPEFITHKVADAQCNFLVWLRSCIGLLRARTTSLVVISIKSWLRLVNV